MSTAWQRWAQACELVASLVAFLVVGRITAFKSVDPDILDLARSSGAGRLRIFRMVQFPSATAAVVAELVASGHPY